MSGLKALASGTLVDVDDAGRATILTCSDLVRVFNGNPEPDSFADTFDDVECGEHLIALEGVSLEDGQVCRAGHEHLSYRYYATSGQEALDAARERTPDDSFNPFTSLAHVV